MSYDDGGYIHSSPKREVSSSLRTIRSFTIKQILNSPVEEPSTDYRIDDVEVTNLQIMGFVRSTRVNTTGTIFNVEDTTGSIECAFWPRGLFEEETVGLIEPPNLLKVVGSIRVFNGVKTIGASFISKIDDTNFFIKHFVECIFQHMFYLKTLKLTKNVKKSENKSFAKIKEDIINCYRSNQDERGIHVDIVVGMLKDKYPEQEVRENIEALLNDCHLYSVEGLEYHTTE
ncbi:Replication factor A protein 2 [Hamiltosporidium tvaerminnensis]|nr:Replication factor A protein 2 [Hamiltosporidium tvaerminnensis]